MFAGVGERTREGNDLYREMIESGGLAAWLLLAGFVPVAELYPLLLSLPALLGHAATGRLCCGNQRRCFRVVFVQGLPKYGVGPHKPHNVVAGLQDIAVATLGRPQGICLFLLL